VRDPQREPAVDEPLDVVAQRRQRDPGRGRDLGGRDRLRVPDVREEPELDRAGSRRTELVLEDPDDVAARDGHFEEEPVVAHRRSVADAASTH
jgi:hypothetical protein